MITLNHAAPRQKESRADSTFGRTTIIIDLPADRVLNDGALIDQVIAQVFDQLAHSVVELRVRAGNTKPGGLPDPPGFVKEGERSPASHITPQLVTYSASQG